MPLPFYPIQAAFNGGEISGRARGRVDLEIYKKSLAYCENWEPLPQGSLRMRAGSKRMANFGALDPKARLIEFRMSNAQDYLLLLLDRVMRVYNIAGTAVANENITTSELIQNSDFKATRGAGWSRSGKHVFFAGEPSPWMLDEDGTMMPYTVNADRRDRAFIFNPANAAPHTGWLFQKITIPIGNTNSVLKVKAAVELGGQCNVIVTRTDPATALIPDVLNATVAPPPNTGDPQEFTFDFGVLAPGDAWVLVRQTGVMDTVLDAGRNYIHNMEIHEVSFQTTRAAGVTDIMTPWTIDQVADIQYVCETGEDRIIFVHPNVAPHYLNYNGPTLWDFREAALTDKPVEWAGDNWPSVADLYGSRLLLGATPKERNRIWASRVGSPFDFSIESIVGGEPTTIASDGFDYKVATKGAFQWMRSNRTMLAGTDLGEHTINASTGVLAPGDVQVREESWFGSSRVQPISAGTHALYTSRSQRKIRAIAYDLQTDGWNSKEITFIAEHITHGKVKELRFAREPNSTIVALLQNGRFAFCTFDAVEGLAAWWRGVFPRGEVMSTASSEGPSGSYLWMLVHRGPNAILERLTLEDDNEDDPTHYVDSHVVVPLVAGQEIVAGLDHLEGETVRVIIDGALAADKVVAGGSITLDEVVTTEQQAVVGVPYTPRAVLLPPEGGNPGGSSQGFKMHRVEVWARLNNSARPLINGERTGDGRPFATPLDTPEELITDDVMMTNIDVERGAPVVITQDLPFRTEICAIFGKTQMSKA